MNYGIKKWKGWKRVAWKPRSSRAWVNELTFVNRGCRLGCENCLDLVSHIGFGNIRLVRECCKKASLSTINRDVTEN